MSSPIKIPERLTRRETAEFLTDRGYQISTPTLATKASRGGGPPYVLFNGRALYEASTALMWARGTTKFPPNAPSF